MSTHTPGPWRAESRSPAGVKWDAIIRSARKGDPICTVFIAGYMEKEANANARLIMAAPDMLAALKGCVVMYGDENPDDDWTAIKKAREAIAKAEGATHSPGK